VDDKEQNEGGPYEATPHADLIAQILDCRVPKNEREWAAGREIDRLTEMVDQLTHFIETNPVQLVADLRRELAEARENLREATLAFARSQKKLAEAQRDAARYRWLRDFWFLEGRLCPGIYSKSDSAGIDAAIDAAMPAP
jgi:hypothetical protein